LINPYLATDKRIVGEIYTSNDLYENLKVLCDKYNSRWPGTEDDYNAAKWMMNRLKAYGIDNAHLESFTFPGWQRGNASLEITSPISKSFDVISLPLGVAGEVESKLVFIDDGHIDVYEERKTEINGNIVMVTSRNPLGMDRFLHRTEKFMRSILAGAKGWVFMNHYPAYGQPTGGISPIIPSVGISYEDGSYLTRLLEQEKEVIARIKTTDKNKTLTSYNVVCEIPGLNNKTEYIICGSHYDGHDISQGAMDPASGASVVLEMAKVLWENKDKLRRRIKLICFGVEEIGLFGSYNYADVHSEELDNCRFMLNLDSAGSPGKKGVILHGFPELESFIKKYEIQMNIELPTYQRVSPYSDHWPFFLKGVPCGSGGDPEARARRTGRGYGHTKFDTVDKVKLEDMRRAASNYARILFRIANDDKWAPNRKTAEEISKFITKQGYDQTVKLVEDVKEGVRKWKQRHPDTEDWLKRDSQW
jgi:Iap family predicted aminopeptidase